jgi:hypothetical protein
MQARSALIQTRAKGSDDEDPAEYSAEDSLPSDDQDDLDAVVDHMEDVFAPPVPPVPPGPGPHLAPVLAPVPDVLPVFGEKSISVDLPHGSITFYFKDNRYEVVCKNGLVLV